MTLQTTRQASIQIVLIPDCAIRWKFADRARRNHALVHGLRAEGRGLREIARHLGWGPHTVQRSDRAATCGLTMTWSSGPVEGRVN
jgi:hypothetical protein